MKEDILERALALFLKHGIREMSNQKLVEQLGISTKTLYKYFKNKEDLLDEALDLFYARHQETWKTLSANKNAVSLFFEIWYTAIEIEYKVNKAFFEELHYYYPALLRKKEASVDKIYRKQFIQVIYDGMDRGVFQSDIHPEMIFMSVTILYDAIVRDQRFNSFRISSNEIVLNTIAPYIRGFCTEKGIKELNHHIQTLKTSAEGRASGRKAPVG